MEKIKVRMAKDKECLASIRYKVLDPTHALYNVSIYVPRAVLGEADIGVIEVTIQEK